MAMTDRTFSIDEVITEAQHLTFKKGDMLALMTQQHLTNQQAADIAARLEEKIPEGILVVVLSSGSTIAKVSFADD